MNTDIVKYLLGHKFDIVCIQEHRLRGRLFHRIKHMLQVRYHFIATHANIKEKAAAGGAMILINKAYTLLPLSMGSINHVDPTGNSVTAIVRLKDCSFMFTSMYLL